VISSSFGGWRAKGSRRHKVKRGWFQTVLAVIIFASDFQAVYTQYTSIQSSDNPIICIIVISYTIISVFSIRICYRMYRITQALQNLRYH